MTPDQFKRRLELLNLPRPATQTEREEREGLQAIYDKATAEERNQLHRELARDGEEDAA
jgi:hypothetical protein